MKEECQHELGLGERKKEPVERILEEELNIRKQKTDHCKYKYIMLRNGVKVLLVEDSKASTSSCALEIEVGNFLDPPHLVGCRNIFYSNFIHENFIFRASSPAGAHYISCF